MTPAIELFRTALIMNNQQEKISLSPDQIRFLKKSAHHLKPCVQVGKKGQSPSLIQEIHLALLAHELIKVQWLPKSKAELEADVTHITKETGSALIATIGNVAILFRQNEKNSSFDLAKCTLGSK